MGVGPWGGAVGGALRALSSGWLRTRILPVHPLGDGHADTNTCPKDRRILTNGVV